MQTHQPALLNDKSSDLVRFYSLIKSPKFKVELLEFADAWEAAGRLANDICPKLATKFDEYIKGVLSKETLQDCIIEVLAGLKFNSFAPLFSDEFIIDKDSFIQKLQASLIDKCKRIKDISIKEKKTFTSRQLCEHIETGIKSGLFLYLRTVMNKATRGVIQLSEEKAAANWYFVRELCYASMFRFNAKSEFNIPYGGIAYNKKNFRQKVEKIFSEDVESLFKNANFYNLDFEIFLKEIDTLEGDFIFLDPPYDSDFSEYDQNAFTKDDQVRLRDSLIPLKAKWMVVIKETDFIRDLYNSSACRVIEFDKRYTYNVRGRNNRDTKHLIILNYDPGNPTYAK